ncbi:MAG: hypothetical protein ACK40G_11970 [Cytophagaceae bacterium]
MKYRDDERQHQNVEKFRKGLGNFLIKKLEKKYKPCTRIDAILGNKDISFFTNEQGEPVTIFIGKRKSNGHISGEQYTRKIKKRVDGEITESHWDNKGRV